MNAYLQLSSIEKHLHSENQMRDRVQLPYQKALAVFHFCVSSNEKLAVAFENFKNLKDKNQPAVSLTTIYSKKDILLHTALDKFTQKLYFTIKNGNEDTLSHLEFDNNTQQFTTLFDRVHFPISRGNYINCTAISSNTLDCIYVAPNYPNFETTWTDSALLHIMNNANPNQNMDTLFVDPDGPQFINNQLYPNDNEFFIMKKKFKSIDSYKSINENIQLEDNQLDVDRGFSSDFNPAHTTILPKDIEYYTKYRRNLFTKNARS